jgi:hypothetical protein
MSIVSCDPRRLTVLVEHSTKLTTGTSHSVLKDIRDCHQLGTWIRIQSLLGCTGATTASTHQTHPQTVTATSPHTG